MPVNELLTGVLALLFWSSKEVVICLAFKESGYFKSSPKFPVLRIHWVMFEGFEDCFCIVSRVLENVIDVGGH